MVGDVSYNYFLDEVTTLNAGLQLLMIEKNDYASDSPLFIGKRQKTTLGFGLSRSLEPNVKFNAALKGFYMNDEKNIYHPNEDLKYKGFSIECSVTYGL